MKETDVWIVEVWEHIGERCPYMLIAKDASEVICEHAIKS